MYRFNFILVCITIIILSACSSSTQSNEEDDSVSIITKEKMIIILADVQITEAYIDELRKAGTQIKDSSMIYFEKVFKKHDITPVEFENSLLFYKKELSDMNEMYKEVITRLNELKAKNEEIVIKMKEDSIIKDSIQKLLELTDSINNLNDSIFVYDSILLNDSIFTNDSILLNDSIIESDTNNIIP